MKVVISQDSLNLALSTVAKAVAKKSTIPVLTGIYVAAQDGMLTLRATDNEMGIQKTIPCQIEEEGAIVLPAQYLTELIRHLDPGDVEITVDKRNWTATLRLGKSKHTMHGWDSIQFPSLPSADGATQFTMRAEALRSLLRRTAFAVGDDASKVWISGILWQLKDGTLTNTSTDGVRIARAETRVENHSGESCQAIVAGRPLSELGRLLYGDEVQVSISRNHAVFQVPGMIATVRLLDGQFPDFMRMIPANYAMQVTIRRHEFIDAMERTMLADNDVNCAFESECVTLTAKRPEVCQVSEEAPARELVGEPVSALFNGKFLMDFLKAVEEPEVRVWLNGPRYPAQFAPADDAGYRYYVMPLILKAV